MPTEVTTANQVVSGEGQWQWLYWINNWIKAQCIDNPQRTGIVVLGLLIVALFIVIPLLLAYCRWMGITEFCGFAITSKKPTGDREKNDKNHNKEDNKKITFLGPGAQSSKYKSKKLPKGIEKLVDDIKSAQPGARFRVCVVCGDDDKVLNYGIKFYESIIDVPVLDHYGWVHYAAPSDGSKMMELCIRNCLFSSLKLNIDIQDQRKRFDTQMEFFDKSDIHTLLVIVMNEPVPKTDYELRQITGQKGLSLVLFSTQPVDGYNIIRIPQRGGK